MQPAFGEVYELLCAIVRGERVGGSAVSEPHFLAACTAHSVAPLVYQHLHQAAAWDDWPPAIRATLAHWNRVQTAAELLRAQELRLVLRSLADHGVQPLLMKGMPLAYTHYPSPSLRPRSDTDLLIQRHDLTSGHQVLTALGYTPLNALSGRFVRHQCTYIKDDRHGLRHAYDVHWKISNPHLFSDILSFEELATQAIPVPALGAHARTLTPVHALLLACIHRVAHHHNSDCLIWLYDIALLVTSLTHDEQTAFGQLAMAKRVGTICASGLRLAQRCFATPLPAALVEALPMLQGAAADDETSARFLLPHRRRWHLLAADVQALPGWQSKWRLLREYALPSASYLRTLYGASNPAWLPVLYLHRALQIIRRLMHRLS